MKLESAASQPLRTLRSGDIKLSRAEKGELAGFIGMRVATAANVRTEAAARSSLNKALEVAFAGGAVMGLSPVLVSEPARKVNLALSEAGAVRKVRLGVHAPLPERT